MSKSKMLCAIDNEKKELILSTGFKLFGDFISRNKADVKSAAKRETRLEGYFLYYMNKIDFESQIKSAQYKIEKNSIYSDKNLQYPEFIKYSKYLLEYLKNRSNPENFNIRFIIQSENEPWYQESSIEKFFEYYKSMPNNLIE